MPFKSEKQRRYLWANEPEIARKWAEKYNTGGLIQPNDPRSIPRDPLSLGDLAGIGAGFVPGAGEAMDALDTYTAAREGRWGDAALTAGTGLIGLIPGVGDAAATAARTARRAEDFSIAPSNWQSRLKSETDYDYLSTEAPRYKFQEGGESREVAMKLKKFVTDDSRKDFVRQKWMSDAEKNLYNELPETVTLFRLQDPSKSLDELNVSWTTEPNLDHLQDLAGRIDQPLNESYKIFSINVPKSEVLAVLGNKAENEAVVNPNWLQQNITGKRQIGYADPDLVELDEGIEIPKYATGGNVMNGGLLKNNDVTVTMKSEGGETITYKSPKGMMPDNAIMGGLVNGKAPTPVADNKMIAVTPGEFVVNYPAAQKYKGLLNQINDEGKEMLAQGGWIDGYAGGGGVSDWERKRFIRKLLEAVKPGSRDETDIAEETRY